MASQMVPSDMNVGSCHPPSSCQLHASAAAVTHPGVWLLEVPSPALLRERSKSNGERVALAPIHLTVEYLYFQRIFDSSWHLLQCLTTL